MWQVRAAGKQLTPQATSATAKLKTVVSGYLEEVFQEFDFPEEFRSRSLMGNQRDYTQYQVRVQCLLGKDSADFFQHAWRYLVK